MKVTVNTYNEDKVIAWGSVTTLEYRNGDLRVVTSDDHTSLGQTIPINNIKSVHICRE